MRKRTDLLLHWSSACIIFTLSALRAGAQPADTTAPVKTVAAETAYLNGIANEGSMGRRYRLEWSIPVQAPVANLSQLHGGLVPMKTSNTGSAATSLQLHAADGSLFALRSLPIALDKQLPEIYQNSIISGFAADLGSAFHPYAPLTIAPLAKAAGLPAAQTELVYLPQQTALGPLASGLYYLHHQPFSLNADTLFETVSTQRLLQLIDSSGNFRVNETEYLRSRLLDMFLGIGLRRAADWQWIAKEQGGVTYYRPYTESYETAYGLFEGNFMKIARVAAKPKGLVSFEAKMPDVIKLNDLSLNFDHRFTSSLSRSDWETIARQLQQALNDDVLITALQQIPAAALAISGRELLVKLKSRREQLVSYALNYYQLLSREVNVAATEANDHVTITGNENGQLAIGVGAQQNAADTSAYFYNRVFDRSETRSVNVYGRGGVDHFVVNKEAGRKIKVRVIGGPDEDSLISDDRSGIHYYDTRTVRPLRSRQVRLHLRNNTSVHRYDWEDLAFNRRGLSPVLFYNNNDRIYAGLAYQWMKVGWRKQPFAQQHKLQLNYSILQGGVSAGYEGIFNQLIGQWNGLIGLEYDAVRWTNFFGIGNETPPQVADNNFHRMRTSIFNSNIGLFRNFGKGHSFGVNGVYQTVKIRNDQDRYIAKFMSASDPKLFETHQFAGGRATYTFESLDHELLPHRGLMLQGSATYLKNLKEQERETMNYDGNLQFFVPLGRRLVWSTLGGIRAATGDPEFYQLATVGGGPTLRGYRRERFWGKTAAYAQNELQYLIPYRSYWFNGTIGFFGMFDAGRIWQPGENSNKLHRGFGGGLILSPFHKVRVSVAYAKSPERGMLHIGLRGNL